MKARSRDDIVNEVVADYEVGPTIGQLAGQLGQHTLEQIITDGAHMLMRGTFGSYEIEAAFAAIVFALEDKLPNILSDFHPSLNRGTLLQEHKKASQETETPEQFAVNDEIIMYYPYMVGDMLRGKITAVNDDGTLSIITDGGLRWKPDSSYVRRYTGQTYWEW